MQQRSEWQRRSWLAIGALLLVAAGARTQHPVPATDAAARDAIGGARETGGTREPGEAVPEETVPDSSFSPSSSTTAHQRAVPSAGVRAFIDPTTGELTANPSPEQLRRMALAPRAALSRSMVGLRPFELGGGGRGVNLQGRFASALRVQVATDGSFHMTCGDPAHDGEPHSHDGAATTDAAATRSDSDRPAER
jgi:hypothetical protein